MRRTYCAKDEGHVAVLFLIGDTPLLMLAWDVRSDVAVVVLRCFIRGVAGGLQRPGRLEERLRSALELHWGIVHSSEREHDVALVQVAFGATISVDGPAIFFWLSLQLFLVS